MVKKKSERRHEERVRHPRLTAVCSPLEWTPAGRSQNVVRSLLDVSTGGARVVLNRVLDEGEPVTVRLDGVHSRRSVTVAGEIRWLEPLPSVEGATLAYVAGLRFRRTTGLLDLLLKA